MMEQVEPQYEVEEIFEIGSSEPVEVLRRCLHANKVDVESGSEVVARLCLDCDAQLEVW